MTGTGLKRSGDVFLGRSLSAPSEHGEGLIGFPGAPDSQAAPFMQAAIRSSDTPATDRMAIGASLGASAGQADKTRTVLSDFDPFLM